MLGSEHQKQISGESDVRLRTNLASWIGDTQGFASLRPCYGTQTQMLFSPLTHAPVLAPVLVQVTGGLAGGSQSRQ